MSQSLEIDLRQPATLPQICAGIFLSVVTATIGCWVLDGLLKMTTEGIPKSFYLNFAIGFSALSLPIGYFIRRRSAPGAGMGICLGTAFIVFPVLLFLQGLVDSLDGLFF